MKKGKEKGGGTVGSGREEKEDIFQAVLLADNFGSSIFGQESPLEQEGLIALANRPLIDYSLEALTVSGVQEIIIFCSREIEALKSYLSKSRWLEMPSVSITIVASEDANSLGDAMRDLDTKRLIRNDFILMQAGCITNLQLRPMLEKHRLTMSKDKGALLTLLYRKMLPGHRSTPDNKFAVVVESRSDKIIAYNKLKGKKFLIPLENVKREMDLLLDYSDTGVIVCSSSVPPIFTDNFDFSTLEDFIKEILINEEIMGNSLYLERIDANYANRVVDFKTFNGITCDILNRWAYPIAPDHQFGPSSVRDSAYNMLFNFIYKGENITIAKGSTVTKLVIIGSNTVINKDSSISTSTIGENCKIGSNVKIVDSYIGKNVLIEDNCVIIKSVVADGSHLTKGTELKELSLFAKNKIHSITQEEVVQEDYDAEEFTSEDEDDQEIPNQDADFERFTNEVIESLHRGYLEDIVLENLILEINSSKFANNVSMKEVTTGVGKGVLSILPKQADFYKLPASAQWGKLKGVLEKFQGLLRHYSKTNESQMDLITAIEEYANDNKEFRLLLNKVLHTLYEEDILTEEIIFEWHKNPSLYDAAIELRKLVIPFIQWLEQDSDDSDSDD